MYPTNNSHVQPNPLQHHFNNLAQQYESSIMGMWIFLVTEILFFGGVFLADRKSVV